MLVTAKTIVTRFRATMASQAASRYRSSRSWPIRVVAIRQALTHQPEALTVYFDQKISRTAYHLVRAGALVPFGSRRGLATKTGSNALTLERLNPTLSYDLTIADATTGNILCKIRIFGAIPPDPKSVSPGSEKTRRKFAHILAPIRVTKLWLEELSTPARKQDVVNIQLSQILIGHRYSITTVDPAGRLSFFREGIVNNKETGRETVPFQLFGLDRNTSYVVSINMGDESNLFILLIRSATQAERNDSPSSIHYRTFYSIDSLVAALP